MLSQHLSMPQLRRSGQDEQPCPVLPVTQLFQIPAAKEGRRSRDGDTASLPGLASRDLFLLALSAGPPQDCS